MKNSILDKEIKDIKEYICNHLEKRSKINYTQVIKLTEKILEKNIYEIDSQDAKVLQKNLEKYKHLGKNRNPLAKTTEHYYRRVLFKAGRKIEEYFNEYKEKKELFVKIMGYEYKSPFEILDDKIQFEKVKKNNENDKIEYIPQKEVARFISEYINVNFLNESHKNENNNIQINNEKREELLNKKDKELIENRNISGDISFREVRKEKRDKLIFALLYFLGLTVNELCNLRHEDFLIDEKEESVILIEKKKQRNYKLSNNLIKIYFNYLYLLKNTDNKSSKDSLNPRSLLFTNQSGNALKESDIDEIFEMKSKLLGMGSIVRKEHLQKIARLRSYYSRLYGNKELFGSYIDDMEFAKIEKEILREKIDETKKDSIKINSEALDYVMSESIINVEVSKQDYHLIRYFFKFYENNVF